MAGAKSSGGWIIGESLAAGHHPGRALCFGTERNVGGTLQVAADDLGIAVHIVACIAGHTGDRAPKTGVTAVIEGSGAPASAPSLPQAVGNDG